MRKVILWIKFIFYGKWYLLDVIILVVLLRLFAYEIYFVDTPSMIPSILPTEVYYVDKFCRGALLPRRFADIPIINVFTWIKPFRKMDEKNDWGFHRAPGLGEIQSGDVILFHAKDDDKTVLVKRIANIVYENGGKYYYVLGDNANNSTDSRHFGLVSDSLVIGKATFVLFSWDNQAKGLQKIRWHRVGYNISNKRQEK